MLQEKMEKTVINITSMYRSNPFANHPPDKHLGVASQAIQLCLIGIVRLKLHWKLCQHFFSVQVQAALIFRGESTYEFSSIDPVFIRQRPFETCKRSTGFRRQLAQSSFGQHIHKLCGRTARQMI